jgi:4-hydroxybenzoyl-CoA reductase subunit beta
MTERWSVRRAVVRLPKFDYRKPATIKEASVILSSEPGSRVLAGGTDLLVNMKHRVETPGVLVNIKGVAKLDYIRRENGAARIGALTRLKRIFQSSMVVDGAAALASAASHVGSYHHQVMGTVGGNLCQQNRCKYFNQSQRWRAAKQTCFKAGGEICHVVNKKAVCYSAYCGDLAPSLLVLDAKILLSGVDGAREISLETFFSGNGKAPLGLGKGEILTEIIIPETSFDGSSVYVKFANRESIDFPIVGAAFWMNRDKREYRAAFTAVDRKPLRARRVEALLSGKPLTDTLIEEAVELAHKEASPVKSSLYSPSYKRNVMGLLLRNCIREAIGRTKA